MASSNASIVEGSGVNMKYQSGNLIINWPVTPTRKVIQFEQGLFVYLLGMH